MPAIDDWDEFEKKDKSGKVKADYEKAEKDLIAEHLELPYNDQGCTGDASETGLIKFIEPLFRKDINGAKRWPTDGIEGFRNAHPILKHTPRNDADPAHDYKIDFNSNIKFNLLIRDMNPAEKAPEFADDNITVYLKGAPDKVLVRCDKILYQNKARVLTDQVRKEILDANELFGNMGERVLGFSRFMLHPDMH